MSATAKTPNSPGAIEPRHDHADERSSRPAAPGCWSGSTRGRARPARCACPGRHRGHRASRPEPPTRRQATCSPTCSANWCRVTRSNHGRRIARQASRQRRVLAIAGSVAAANAIRRLRRPSPDRLGARGKGSPHAPRVPAPASRPAGGPGRRHGAVRARRTGSGRCAPLDEVGDPAGEGREVHVAVVHAVERLCRSVDPPDVPAAAVRSHMSRSPEWGSRGS